MPPKLNYKKKGNAGHGGSTSDYAERSKVVCSHGVKSGRFCLFCSLQKKEK